MNKIASLFLARGRKIFVYPITALIAVLVASRGEPPIINTILTVVASLLVATSVYVYNDVCDLEMDRLNPQKRDRPLTSGRVTVKEAMRLVYFSGFTGLALSLLIGIEPFLLCTIYVVLLFLYSNPNIRLKKRFLLKELVTSLAVSITCLLGGIVVGSISVPIIFLALFYFGYGMVIVGIDEAYDVEEDEKFGCRTIAMVLSWKRMVQLFIGFLLIMMVTMPLTYQYLGFNTLFPIGMVIMCGLSLYLTFPYLNRSEEMLTKRLMLSLYFPWLMTGVSVVIGSLSIPF